MEKYYVVKTLGCKANFYDSQLIEAELRKHGWEPASMTTTEDPAPIQLCIVNSCTVTDEADRQSRRMASRLFRENPGAAVVITGCAAEVDPERLTKSKGIHYVIGNRSKPKLVELILERLQAGSERLQAGSERLQGGGERQAAGEMLGHTEGYREIASRHPIEREWPTAPESFFTPPVELEGHSAKTRAFLKIQEGCNSFCTYCIIPYGRGPNRSLRPREVIAQVRELVAQGVREIVITGTNIGDYGTDWSNDGQPCADELLDMILGETDLERLRVSSLDPTEITPRMLQLMKRDPRFCPHFHVSLQSPHDRILKLMKRKYNALQVRDCLERIAAIPAGPGGVFVGMDVITGFPGEGEREFEESLRSFQDLPWTRLHVFPFSEREGTPATRLPGSVPREERTRRARELNRLSLERLTSVYRAALESVEREHAPISRILLEKPGKAPAALRPQLALSGDSWVSGYSANYLRVLVPATRDEPGNRIVSAAPVRLLVDEAAGDVAIEARLTT